MSSERKEPTVSSVLNTKEDLVDRHVRAAARTARNTQTPPVETSRPGASSGFLWFTFLVTLCALGVAAYSVWQLQAAQRTLADQRTRIISLERKLTLSDDSATQSLESVGVKVRELNEKAKLSASEIAKLWDARKVSRKAIKDNKEQLASVQKQQKTQKKTLSSLDKKAKSADKSIAKIAPLQAKVDATSQSVGEQELLLQSLRERVKAQGTTLDTAARQAQQGAAVAGQLSDVNKRLKTSEESLKSLEAFRRTVNRDLLQLKQKQP